MLVTDGAVETYDAIFAKYNWPERKVVYKMHKHIHHIIELLYYFCSVATIVKWGQLGYIFRYTFFATSWTCNLVF